MEDEKKDYIEGIYNYCDRWCEKCCYTANCFLFTEESKIKTYEILHNGDISGFHDYLNEENGFPCKDSAENEDDDADNEEPEYLEYYREAAEWGEDDSSDSEQESEELNHPLSDMLNNYLDRAEALTDSLNEKYNFCNCSGRNIEDTFVRDIFRDFETFNWYYTFLSVKIKRALFGLKDLSTEDDEELKAIHRFDINGSAKIGIIAIKKTIDALNNLYIKLPSFNDEIGDLLISLGKILNIAEITFPDCMKFKRPGLDD